VYWLLSYWLLIIGCMVIENWRLTDSQ